MNLRRCILPVLLYLGLSFAFADELESAISQAQARMEIGDYAGARQLLSQAAKASPSGAGRLAEAYAEIGVAEYDRRNFQNAYLAFRESLKLQATNQTATQYYLRMRREMDVAHLKNEYEPPAGSEGAAKGAPHPAETAAAAPASTAPNAVQTQSDREEDLRILIDQLKVAETRLSAVEITASSRQTENETMRQQLESQRQLMERMLVSQRTSVASPSASDNARLEETIRLLSEVVEREQNRTIVVQSDPALQGLVERMAETQEKLRKGGPLDIALVAVLSLIGASLAGLSVFVILAVAHARKRKAGTAEAGFEVAALPAAAAGDYAVIGMPRSESPLLEFIGAGPKDGDAMDLAIRRDLLKAERLNRMYEEVRSGSLSWNTVRQYIGELELSLRADILKTVELKLDEGDLISNEAVLPVLFPFLTDYDDFLRKKSESLARRALEAAGKGGSSSFEGEEGTDDLDPLSIKNLLHIPEKLQTVFRNQDQTLLTAKLCRGMAAVLGFSSGDRNLLYKAALAHDCGYLLLDRDRLARTIAKREIDDEDFKFIQSHAAAGIGYFGEAKLPDEFRSAIVHHHERKDGSGYPDGLKKDEIPLFARVIGIAETFAALVSKRSYRDKRDVTHALAIISDGARSKFDPDHVEALAKVAASIEVA